MFKAAQVRAKDVRDAEVTLPLLSNDAKAWLRDAVARFAPDHPWARAG